MADDLHFETADARLWQPAERICPKCGPHRQGALTIVIDGVLDDDGRPVSGDYCLRCFARWASMNFPRLS